MARYRAYEAAGLLLVALWSRWSGCISIGGCARSAGSPWSPFSSECGRPRAYWGAERYTAPT